MQRQSGPACCPACRRRRRRRGERCGPSKICSWQPTPSSPGLDEVMLGCPDWGAAIANLQGEILGTQIARETFFNYLEDLDDSQDEVREVYYVLLCLGFRGFYGELSQWPR